MTPDQKMEAARAVVKGVNASLAAYEQIRDIEIMDSEFEKTPKRSIKRFLYLKQ